MMMDAYMDGAHELAAYSEDAIEDEHMHSIRLYAVSTRRPADSLRPFASFLFLFGFQVHMCMYTEMHMSICI